MKTNAKLTVICATILVGFMATLAYARCGYAIIVTKGNDAGSASACQPIGDPPIFPGGNTPCNYHTFSPAKTSCGTQTDWTGDTCSYATTNTTINVSIVQNGACDGHGSCTGGTTLPGPTPTPHRQAYLTRCGG